MTGCRAQQTCSSVAEQTVEVVRIHEGGTGPGVLQRWAEGIFGCWEWTQRECRWRGEPGRIPRETECLGARFGSVGFEVEAKIWSVGQTIGIPSVMSREREEDLEDPALKRGQGRGGSGEGQRPATHVYERRFRVVVRHDSRLARPRGSRQLHGSCPGARSRDCRSVRPFGARSPRIAVHRFSGSRCLAQSQHLESKSGSHL